jgi:uncharacterized membrane protein
MRTPWLVLLFVSLALNLFLVGAFVGAIALGLRMARENGAPGALAVATRDLPQPDRRNFRQMLAGERAAAASDVQRSRDLRAAAWGALAEAKPDTAAIKSQLAQSRQIDLAVRTRVEERIVDYAAGLSGADRATFAAGMRKALTPPGVASPAATNTAVPR